MQTESLLTNEAIAAQLRASVTPGRAYVAVPDRGLMVKVVDPDADPTVVLRANDLAREAEILRTLASVRGVPTVRSVTTKGCVQVLATEWIDGESIESRPLRMRDISLIVRDVCRIAIAMSIRGISHNDIKLDNVLLSSDGRSAWLIDFDQATTGHAPWHAFVRNMIGSRFYRDEVVVHGSVSTLIRGIARRRLLWLQRRMPSRRRLMSVRHYRLYHAWLMAQRSSANAPGAGVAYYALDLEGVHFPGERPWEARWRVLAAITDLRNKSILEIGCNMGLFSVWALKFAGAREALGIDHDELIIEAARAVADAFDVDASFRVVDLERDEAAVEALVATRYDLVTCLNVWNWVTDKRLLSRVLATAPELLFEGHDDADTETARLQAFGFSHVQLITKTERGRPLLFARRFVAESPR